MIYDHHVIAQLDKQKTKSTKELNDTLKNAHKMPHDKAKKIVDKHCLNLKKLRSLDSKIRKMQEARERLSKKQYELREGICRHADCTSNLLMEVQAVNRKIPEAEKKMVRLLDKAMAYIEKLEV